MGRQRKTLKGLAEAIDRSEPTAQSRRDGQSEWHFDELMAVVAWLGVPLSQLYREDTADQQVSNVL